MEVLTTINQHAHGIARMAYRQHKIVMTSSRFAECINLATHANFGRMKAIERRPRPL
jgi:hypothetical protein